jgi:hypothetical protein
MGAEELWGMCEKAGGFGNIDSSLLPRIHNSSSHQVTATILNQADASSYLFFTIL